MTGEDCLPRAPSLEILSALPNANDLKANCLQVKILTRPRTARRTARKWLPGEDSNLECLDQNQMCCRLHHRVAGDSREIAGRPARGGSIARGF